MQKSVDCCYHAALMTTYGRGQPQDYQQAAIRMLELVTEYQFGPAAYYMALFLLNGDGVPKDEQHAHMFLKMAIESGDPRVGSIAHKLYNELNRGVVVAESNMEATLAYLQSILGAMTVHPALHNPYTGTPDGS